MQLFWAEGFTDISLHVGYVMICNILSQYFIFNFIFSQKVHSKKYFSEIWWNIF